MLKYYKIIISYDNLKIIDICPETFFGEIILEIGLLY